MQELLEPSWRKILSTEFESDYFKNLSLTVEADYLCEIVYPPRELLFNALNLCPLSKTKVVILGQDPYHGPNQAHGLAFSVSEGVKIPPSLKNIYREIKEDIGGSIPESGKLSRWSEQGVLLLNSALTVRAGKAGSHQKLGWEKFTDSIIKKVSSGNEHVVFLLWGNFARSKAALIDSSKHLILEAPHPSPLSAYTGFFGCQHFSQTNTYLKQHGLTEIQW